MRSRDREKTMLGVKKMDTPILQGMQIFYNYIRPHGGLDEAKPAEVCRIEIRLGGYQVDNVDTKREQKAKAE